jgi:hypothetical protein
MRFNIRDILWLTILVAIAVAWWLDHRAGIQIQQQLRFELFGERLGWAQRSVADTDERVRVLTLQVQKAQLEAAKSEYDGQPGSP